MAPVITKLDLVWRQLRLLGSNKTFETKVFAENMVDMPRRDIFEGEDLGLAVEMAYGSGACAPSDDAEGSVLQDLEPLCCLLHTQKI